MQLWHHLPNKTKHTKLMEKTPPTVELVSLKKKKNIIKFSMFEVLTKNHVQLFL